MLPLARSVLAAIWGAQFIRSSVKVSCQLTLRTSLTDGATDIRDATYDDATILNVRPVGPRYGTRAHPDGD